MRDKNIAVGEIADTPRMAAEVRDMWLQKLGAERKLLSLVCLPIPTGGPAPERWVLANEEFSILKTTQAAKIARGICAGFNRVVVVSMSNSP